jgi:hypothetical protein
MLPLKRDGMGLGCIELHSRPLLTVTCRVGAKRSIVGSEFDIDMTPRATVIGQESMFMNKVRAEMVRRLR